MTLLVGLWSAHTKSKANICIALLTLDYSDVFRVTCANKNIKTIKKHFPIPDVSTSSSPIGLRVNTSCEFLLKLKNVNLRRRRDWGKNCTFATNTSRGANLPTWSHKNTYLCALSVRHRFTYLSARFAAVSKRHVHWVALKHRLNTWTLARFYYVDIGTYCCVFIMLI